jgi:hypothetical protein
MPVVIEGIRAGITPNFSGATLSIIGINQTATFVCLVSFAVFVVSELAQACRTVFVACSGLPNLSRLVVRNVGYSNGATSKLAHYTQ